MVMPIIYLNCTCFKNQIPCFYYFTPPPPRKKSEKEKSQLLNYCLTKLCSNRKVVLNECIMRYCLLTLGMTASTAYLSSTDSVYEATRAIDTDTSADMVSG